uniref:4-diphosphocytidyl-2-C-methyl-D-erythritol kinase n=1 Tax=Magnetococcus massalia (strain MO-1) TaxID=451514 RepID=A0A1S7LII1_MAGMO|nr:4-diphosphocytidyl-2-C-methyl-D-erythritol kinase [Candidatus Magnetococcus massalia]
MTVQKQLLAPAKINLTLRVVGRRGDGYHLLESIMVYLPLYDTLAFSLRTDRQITLRCEPEVTVAAEENLVFQAAQQLQQQAGVQQGVDIQLKKSIPHGAGLGGGSSDCATTLLALNQLWGVGWSSARLRQLGVTLGADVPIFLLGQGALAEGVGEQLTPIAKLPSWPLVVVNPGVALSTVEVFKAHAKRVAGRYSEPGEGRGWLELPELEPTILCNDLTADATGLCPQVAQALELLNDSGAMAAEMSGSGATVYGVYESRELAQKASEILQAKQPQWLVLQTEILND